MLWGLTPIKAIAVIKEAREVRKYVRIFLNIISSSSYNIKLR